MTTQQTDDPFSPEADPDFHLRWPAETQNVAGAQCHCTSTSTGVSRRNVLLGAGVLSLVPVTSVASVLQIPCIQDTQRIKRCRHRFCRHYGGRDEYYGR